jgi:hypothetical protein
VPRDVGTSVPSPTLAAANGLEVCFSLHSICNLVSCAFFPPEDTMRNMVRFYPIGQGSFSDGMPLGISGTFNFMIVFQAEHNILMLLSLLALRALCRRKIKHFLEKEATISITLYYGSC